MRRNSREVCKTGNFKHGTGGLWGLIFSQSWSSVFQVPKFSVDYKLFSSFSMKDIVIIPLPSVSICYYLTTNHYNKFLYGQFVISRKKTKVFTIERNL